MCAQLPSVFQTAVECDGLGGACTAGLGGVSASRSLPFLLKARGDFKRVSHENIGIHSWP